MGGDIGGLAAGNSANIVFNGGTSLSFNRNNDFTIANSISGTSAVTKSGGGTATFSGLNTYTGATSVNGGRLVLDYTTNDPLGAGALAANGGNVVFQGKTSGTTADTVSSLTLGSTNNGTVSTVTLNANGGSGFNLTVSSLSSGTLTTVSNLFDLSSSAGNSITVGGLGANLAGANGILASGTTPVRAVNITRTSTGYGFTTLSGGNSGTLGKLSSFTPLTTSNTSATGVVNYQLATAGTLTRSAALDFNTLTLDSSTASGPIILDMGTYDLLPTTANNTGRGILVTGDKDVSITGSGSIASSSVFIYNYGTGIFSLSQTAATSAMVFGGTGFTNYSGMIPAGSATGLFNDGSLLRISTAQNFTSFAAQPIAVSGGGVLEIGADLNGATAGDFSNAVGSGSNQIRFIGNSGLSASGADRIVNFGGAATPNTLTWGAASFLTNPDTAADGGYTFKLSSARADVMVEIRNPINLGVVNRIVETADGGAAVDGRLSGVLSSSGGGLSKTGAGTLQLTGANTYTGATNIQDGTLSVASLNSVTSGTVNSSLGAPTTIASGTIGLGAGTTTGTLQYTGAGETTDRVINLAGTTGGGVIDQSGAGLLKFTGNLTATSAGSKTLTLQGSTTGAGEISGAIVNGAGTTALTKAGIGTWTLTGANTYTGTTTINGGTLNAGVADVAGTSGALGNGGNITFGGGTLQHSAASAGTDYSGRIKNSASAISVDTNGQTVTYASPLDGSNTGGLTKLGAGELKLTAANSYTGATTISAGTLNISETGSIGGATNPGTDVAVNSTGILVNNGTIRGATTVNSGGTLRGNGTFIGNVTIASGGNHLPGNSPGRTVMVGNYDINAGGMATYELAGITNNVFAINPGNGTDPASILATASSFFAADPGGANGFNAGAPSNNGMASGNFDPAITSAGPPITYAHQSFEIDGNVTNSGTIALVFTGALSASTVQLGMVFDLFDVTGTTDVSASDFTTASFFQGGVDSPLGFTLPSLSGTPFFYNVSLLETQGLLVVVPEPSRALLLLAGAALLAGRRRR